MVDGERICVVVGRTRHKMIQVEIQEAAKHGAQMIELRLDFLAKALDFRRLLATRPCEMVATVRRPEEGGRWKGTEEERLMLLRQAIAAGFDWVDLETDIAQSIPRYRDVKRIISYHNLRGVPDDLEEIHEVMCGQDADVVKIAVAAHQPADNLRVLRLTAESPVPTVAFCMGDLGVPTRILCGKYGAPFTYAAFNKERGIAPGILSYDEMRGIYHYEKINAETKVFGVIGDPVGHSLSPLIHNRAFQSLGMDCVYLPFRVPRGALADFLTNFDALEVQGYSVTIPHKEAAANLAKQQDPSVSFIHAANTLVRSDDGFIAHNTDFQAAREAILEGLPLNAEGEPPPLAGRTALVLGAGGVARAMAHVLQREGLIVTITNRTPEKAHHLAEEVGCRAIDWAARHTVICEFLVNCTSVGMHPNLDDCPVHSSLLKPGLIVMECIYTPEQTLLVKEARLRHCHVITGIEMFVRQAALQFELFTGRKAPLDLMRATVKRALSPINLSDEEET